MIKEVAVSLFAVWAIVGAATNQAQGAVSESDYLEAVKQFADTAILRGRDTYGPKKTPMFVDGLSVLDYSPARWPFKASYAKKNSYPKQIISSNFTSHQQLQVTLRELSRLTGDSKYEKAAREAAQYMLANLKDQNGLLYWGHHGTYDVLNDVVAGLAPTAKRVRRGGTILPLYEMNATLPDYRYLHSVNQTAVKGDISQFFKAGVMDWKRLAITRHSSYATPGIGAWERSSEINTNQSVPFRAPWLMDHWQYLAPYIHAGLSYYELTGDERAWNTARQMIERYLDMRNPETKLGPPSYADRSSGSHFTQTDIERYELFPAILIKHAQILGTNTPRGSELLRLGIEEITAFAKYMHVDGTGQYQNATLSGTKIGGKDRILPKVLWNIALGYRLSKDEVLWNAARDVVKSYGLGDIGTSSGQGIAVSSEPFRLLPIEFADRSTPRARNRRGDSNGFVLHALVELYEATGRDEYLEMADNAADAILRDLYDNDLFVRQKNGLYGPLSHTAPLALLHLEAAKNGRKFEVDSVMPRTVHLRIPCGFAECSSDKYWDNEVVFCRNKQTKKCS